MHYGVMLGLSWVDLRATWVNIGAILSLAHLGMVGHSWAWFCIVGPIGAIWALLGIVCPFGHGWPSCANLGMVGPSPSFKFWRHSPCEVGMLILHVFYRCFSTPAWVAEASSCAMSGLSWGYLERTWVSLGGILCHVGAIFGELGRYLVQLGVT